MDPNANLAEQRQLIAELAWLDGQEISIMDEPHAYARIVERLAELAAALDGWLSSGGFLPRAWDASYAETAERMRLADLIAAPVVPGVDAAAWMDDAQQLARLTTGRRAAARAAAEDRRRADVRAALDRPAYYTHPASAARQQAAPCGQAIDATVPGACERPAGHAGPCRAYSLETGGGA